MRRVSWVLVLLASVPVHASVRVAFLETRGPDGTFTRMMGGGRFSHVAIARGDQWFHAHPVLGVVSQTQEELSRLGEVKVILSHTEWRVLPVVFRLYQGLPYDPKFVWGDKTSTYCSKLVALMLGVSPQVLKFTAAYHLSLGHKPRRGISPDELHQALLERGFTPECEGSLR